MVPQEVVRSNCGFSLSVEMVDSGGGEGVVGGFLVGEVAFQPVEQGHQLINLCDDAAEVRPLCSIHARSLPAGRFPHTNQRAGDGSLPHGILLSVWTRRADY